ncbi:MAG: PAS domain-containing protein, partial [Oxalobacteraceae bacterium]
MFWSSKKKGRKDRDKHLESLMVLSQQHLLNAATDTANAAHDVTTKLKARLDDSIRQFENTARILNDGLFLTEMDGTIQSCNPAAGRMFGRSELIGLNIAELFQLGDDRLTTAQAFWVIAEQSSDWLPNNLVPLKARRPCGTLFWFEPSVTRLDWSNGASSMLVLIRNMEPIVGLAAQAKANRGYKKLFDASLEGIMIEQNDRIVAANPAITQLWGYTSEEIMNRPIAVLFEPSETDRVEANDVHSNFGVQGQHSDGHHMSLVFT